MWVAGCDVSTRALDFVVLNSERPSECEHRRVTLASEDGRWWESARGMDDYINGMWRQRDGVTWDSVTGWLVESDVELLGIERPYGPSRGSIASLHTILGAVLATIPSHITVLEVRPAEMRKALGLKGNVSKGEMHLAILRLLVGTPAVVESPESPGTFYPQWPFDALDAWAVAWAAYRMCEKAAAGRAA